MKKLFFTLIAWLFVFALMLPLQNQAATITVTNGNDDGAGSLRAAIAGAMAGDVIDFSGVTTVTLTSDQLFISTNLTINGGTGVTITRDAGAPNFRIFNITSGSAVVEFNKLTITNGKAIPPDGNQAAGIQNSGTLTLNDCTIANNESGFQSGGIQNDKTLTMNRCFVHSNSAPFSGSGLLIYGSSTTTLNNCVFTNNQGNYAIDIQSAATLNITNCTIAKNTGGINVGSGSAVVTLKNTIVAENTVNIQNNVNASSAYNLIGTEGGNGGLTNGTNNNIVGISPRFANSSDPNGADDKFGTADDGLMLTACNLATNVGNNADAPSGTDIAGNTRIFNTTVDIGAYEFQANSSPNPTITLGAIPAILAGATSFTISYTATSSPTTYSILGTGITTVTDVPLSSPITVNLSPAASINIDFTLTVKNANGCISNAVAGYVVVNTPITQACATATFNGTAPIAPTATTAGVGGRGGIHTYTVPAGVTAIRLDAKGAKGGSSPITGGGTYLGGQGGWVQATYAVTPGDVLYILVGGKGGNGSPDDGITGRTASGGGGATVVSKGPIGSGTLLLVAGGGGGAGHLGGGGNSNNAPNSGSGFNGAGGASFSVDGGNSNTSDDCGKGGQALNAGGYGGANTCFRPETNGGGYGGGGAGNYNTGNGNAGGGGGGGYVGGNAGATAGGNGGSSFTDASATDVTTNNHSDDNGSVVIYAVAGTHQMTWTGAVNTDWNTPCNWSPSGIPTATNDVVIPNTTNKPTINTAAVAQTVEVQAGAALTIAATKSLTVNGSKIIGFLLTGFYNAGTVQNNGTLTLGNTGSVGDYGIVNKATFNNNAGEITIDRSTASGLLNEAGGTFTNAAKITIGAMASVGSNGLENKSTFNNNAGEIKIDRSTQVGLSNKFNFTNAAKITIGATASVGDRGLENEVGTFNNTTGGDITINGAIDRGLFNTFGGTFTNVAKISVNGASYGITNYNSSFQNNTNGEIKVDNSLRMGVLNEQGTFTNLAKISINVLDNSTDGLVNRDVFNNSAAGVLEIDGASGTYLVNQRGTFTNAAKIKLGGLSATEAINGIRNEDLFNNNLGGEITIINAEVGFVNSETLTNNALITISGRAETVGFRNGNLVTNNTCGRIILLKGMLLNRSANTFTNRGLVQVTDNLTNEGIFTNNGVLKYGSLTGTVTNSTNPSLIVNDTPTPIFTYGGTYDGVINGIFTDANATVSAGAFSAPNTFTPSGLPLGSQTLYAKITPAGSGCTYVVPFTYINAACNLTDFALSGGGISFCQSPLSIATAGSQIGVNYQLKRNNVNLGNPIEGTGYPLSFPGLTQAGTYTILATSTVGDCSRTLSGEITIQTRNAPTAYNLSGGGASCSGTPVGINLSNSQVGVLYQLKRGTTLVGNPVPGTGNAISFPPQNTAGNYTAVALTQCADLAMNNTVSITSVVTPNTFTVTGGGTSCGTALPVGLSGSQSGVFYQLYRNGSPVGTTVQGTGQAITLGNHLTQGTYTIVATRAGECPTLMTGSVSILLIDSPALFNVIGGGVACPGGVPIGLSGSQSGIQYQLKRGTTLVSTREGDGTPLSFGNQTVAGNYTVEAISQGSCTRTMSGNALVTAGGTLPNIYSMTGGGDYCNNVAVVLGLSDSQAKIFYQLQRNTSSGFVNVGTSVQGTGKALSLGTHSILGEYRVVVNSACMTVMSGSKSITACNARIAADAQPIGITKEAFAQVMPNPVANTLRLKVNDAKDQKVNVSLVDASGRALLQRAFVPQTNQHQEEFEVSDLANGMYFLRVNAVEKHATLKVIKVQ